MRHQLVQAAESKLHDLGAIAGTGQLQWLQHSHGKAAIVADGPLLVGLQDGEKLLAAIPQLLDFPAAAPGLLLDAADSSLDKDFKGLSCIVYKGAGKGAGKVQRWTHTLCTLHYAPYLVLRRGHFVQQLPVASGLHVRGSSRYGEISM